MNPTVAKMLLGTLGQIAGLLNGTIATSLKLISNLFLGGFKMALKFNDTAMAFSRQAGLTAKQAQAYTEVLATRAKDLGAKYGIAAEEVAKLEKNLARATGRVLMLGNAEAERQIQINRTVGEETSNEFTQTIMRTMGGQLSTVQGAVSKAYATAAKKGLDAAGMAAKIGQNLTMANRLTFKNGVDGLTKMVALSEKMGFNIQSLESAANKFMDIQDAIENSAKLSMLGGAAGAYGGNPLDMSYEANYDPEAFGERMTKMLGGYARFDTQTGMAKMNAMSRDFVKGIADAMGISLDEATAIAKKNAEVQFKNNRFGNDIERLSGGDENKKDFLLNKSQYNPQTNTLQMYSSVTKKMEDLSYFQGEGSKELEDMMRFNNMSDEEIMAEQARTLNSIYDTLTGMLTSIQGTMAEKIAPFMPKLKEFLGDLYKMVTPHVEKIAENIKELIQWTLSHMPEIKAGVKTVIDVVGKIATFLTSDWWKLLGAMALMPMLGIIKGIWGLGSKLYNFLGGGKSKTTKPAAKGKPGAKGKSTSSGTWKQIKNWMKNSANKTSGGWWKKGKNALKTLGRHSALAKGASRAFGWAGTALAVGEGAYALYKGSKEKEKIDQDKTKSAQEKERAKQHVNHETSKAVGGGAGALAGGLAGAKVGAVAGALAGPLGAAIGGLIGGAIGGVGGYLGGEWLGGKVVSDAEHHSQGGIVGSITPERHSNGGAVGGNITNNTSSTIMNMATEKHSVGGAIGGNTTNNANTTIMNMATEKHSEGGAVGEVSKPAGEDILTWLKKGEVVLNEKQQQTFTENIKAIPVGQKEYIYIPQNTNTSDIGGKKITVDEIKVNINGTIKLDGGNNSQNIDVRSLLNDVSFISKLKDIIRESMASDINGGRIMNDTAYLRGMPSQSTTLGRLTS